MTENELTNQKNLENQETADKAPEKQPVNETAEAGETITNSYKTPQQDEVIEKEEEIDIVSLKGAKNLSGAHDDFDWDIDRKASAFQESDEGMVTAYENSFKEITDDSLLMAQVASITETDVVLNIGHKSDGLVPKSEFKDLEELKIGDDVEIYVVTQEDEKGNLVLSRRNAKLMRAWQSVKEAHEQDQIVTGKIISKTKGGLIANVFGLETFLPGSQIDVKAITDYDQFVGQTMEFKVVKINETIKNAVVSHKALIESDLEEQRQNIISKLEKGQILEGTIKNITDFGAFIDLGGVDGLLYITDISYGRISHPKEVLELNQKLNVVVLEYDDYKKRISLGLKQMQPHPWEIFDESVKEGSTVKGKVVNIEDYGAFIEIEPGVEGLVHLSEVSWSNHPINSKEYFKMGAEHEAKVVTIDREERKMSLSIKALHPDPWEDIKDKFPVSSKHTGKVKNITPYGVFVEFEEGIGGMVHISDLSWTKRYNHPNEFTKVNEDLEVVVLEIDEEARKLSLGHKQIEEDPWDTFEETFPVGSTHEGTIIKKDDKGGIVALPYGVEAFAPNRHLKKEDGTLAGAEEVLNFKVIEFSRDDKRILISHSRILDDKNRSEKDKERGEKEARVKTTKTAARNLSKNLAKTTFGDLDVLAQLKKQMKDDAKDETAALADTAGETASKVESVKEEVKEKVEEVKDKANEVKEEVKEKAAKAKKEVKEKVEDVKEEVKEKIEEVKDKANEVKEEVKEKVKKAKKEVKEKVEDVKEDVKEKIEEVKEEVKEKATKAKKEVKEKVEDVKEEVKEKIEEVKEEVKEKIEDVKEDVKEVIDKVKGAISGEEEE